MRIPHAVKIRCYAWNLSIQLIISNKYQEIVKMQLEHSIKGTLTIIVNTDIMQKQLICNLCSGNISDYPLKTIKSMS